MELEIIVLSETIQAQKGKYCMICLHIESTNLISQTLNIERNLPEAGVNEWGNGWILGHS